MQPIKPDTLVACLTVEQLTCCYMTFFHRKKKNTVYQLVRQKKIPVYRAAHGGKKLMFKRDETEKWMINKRIGDLDEFIEKKNTNIQKRFQF